MAVKLGIRWNADVSDASYQEASFNDDIISIGRDQSSDLVLTEAVVSRRHARIVREGELYLIEDTGSAHGTRINGALLPSGEKHLLSEGDVIAIGPYDVEFNRIIDPSLQESSSEVNYSDTRVFVQNHLQDFALNKEPFVRVMNGKLEGLRFEIKSAQEFIIGRDFSVDIHIDDDLVSRRHAKLRRDWSGTYIEDLKSRNGIQVNGVGVESHALKNRDQIEIGGTRLLFVDPSELPDSPKSGMRKETSFVASNSSEGEETFSEEMQADMGPDIGEDIDIQVEESSGPDLSEQTEDLPNQERNADSEHNPGLVADETNEEEELTGSGLSPALSDPKLDDWKKVVIWTLLGLVMLTSITALIASFFVG